MDHPVESIYADSLRGLYSHLVVATFDSLMTHEGRERGGKNFHSILWQSIEVWTKVIVKVPLASGPHYSCCAAWQEENWKGNFHKNTLSNLTTKLLKHSVLSKG